MQSPISRALRSLSSLALAVGVLQIGSACTTGHQPRHLSAARNADGVGVMIRASQSTTPLTGELFAVDSTGLYLRMPHLTHIAWNRVESVELRSISEKVTLSKTRGVTQAELEKLANASRFPLGMSPALLTQLLAALDQPEVTRFR